MDDVQFVLQFQENETELVGVAMQLVKGGKRLFLG